MAKLRSCLALVSSCAVIAAAFANPVSGQGTWETALAGRDINGHPVGESDAMAVFLYDKALDITWLRDANVNGQLDWASAKAWTNRLTVGAYGGWRLPTMMDTGSPGCDFSYAGTDCGFNVQTESGGAVYSEMAHLWYVTLANTAYFDSNGVGPQLGWGLSNSGPFLNLQADSTRGYWFGLEYATFPGVAWSFGTDDGSQNTSGQGFTLYAMAVRNGDVAAVPEPTSVAMTLVGLIGLCGVLRLRSSCQRRRPRLSNA